ncbi:MAG: polyprenyl synthetase family protein [Ruminococcaceae bacterium]|nr:polyprenyl synthetase family protein [Oscillospiraceae bacterium]
MNIKTDVAAKAALIEAALAECLPKRDSDTAVLTESIEYALMSGGKRIRPYLTLAFCELFGGDEKAAMPYACAVEMIHNYSLVHDDLPCMDNDDMRRGKPTCHKKFGETTALLAGDALLTEAFSVIANNDLLSAEKNVKATAILARAAGAVGMVGGQVMDLDNAKNGGFDRLLKLHSKKTGAMICAAAQLGCIAAGIFANSPKFEDATAYAEKIGLTFQIIDDILDYREGESAEEKETFISYLDEKASYEYAKKLTDEAVALIEKHRGSEKLVSLAHYLLDREI